MVCFRFLNLTLLCTVRQIKAMKKIYLFLSLVCCLSFGKAFSQSPPDTVVKTIYTTYYAKKFEGRKTTSGERYRAAKLTAAHRTLPFGTLIKVRNLHTNKTVEVRVNDRGPFSKKFELDLSQSAAKALGIYHLGYAKVEISYVIQNY